MSASVGTKREIKTCKGLLAKEIQDWQADLLIEVTPFDKLTEYSMEHLLEMLDFYEDTLKNGKRY